MKAILFLLTLLIVVTAPAQTTIEGIIRSNEGEPLPGANIYLEQTQIGTSSDADGKFVLTTQLSGKVHLKVNYIGYKSVVKPIVLSNEKVVVEIILKPSFNLLDAVTITAGAFEASDKMKSVELKTLDIVTTAGALGDIGGALQTLPGTSTVGESGRLFVRGGDATETQVFIDGMLVSTPYTSGPPNLAVRGRFNPFIFSGTIFGVGGYSAEYGQALSSVLQLNTTDLPQENKTDISLMTVGAGAATTRLWDDAAVTATVDYFNLTPYTALVAQNVDWVQPLESIGGELSFRQKTKDNGMFKFYSKVGRSNMKLNLTDLDVAEGYRPFELLNDNIYINSNWKSTLGDKWSIKTGASYTKNSDDILISAVNVEEKLESGFLKLVLNNYTSDRITIKFGGESLIQQISETINLDSFKGTNKFTEKRFAGFSEAEIYLSSRWALRIGSRIEQSDISKQVLLSPRFSTAYKVDEFSQLSFAYGRFFQSATADVLLKTADIEEQEAAHYIINYQINKNRRLFRVEPYYKDYNKLVTYTSDFSEIGNEGNAYAYGLDVFYKDLRTIKNAQFWISYSYLNTERKYRDYPTQAVPTFASEHSFSLVYKQWVGSWKSMLSASLRYSAPRTFNNPNQSEFNNSYTKAFRTVDVSWSYLPKKHIIFYTAVTNLLGFENQFGSRFSTEPDANGQYAQSDILPSAKRFFFIGCFLTFTKKGEANQLDKLD